MLLLSTAHDQLSLIERALVEKYDGRVSTSTIHDEVTGIAAGLRDARIQTYVPLLVKRQAEDRVRQLVNA